MDDTYYQMVAREMRRGARRGGRLGTEELMSHAPVRAGQALLDVGMGTGEASVYFARRNVNVTATGMFHANYGLDLKLLKSHNVELVECTVESMPFKSSSFDACWMSHVLEHCLNPGLALRSVWNVLKDNGWLFVMVPPYKSNVVGGHVMTGWNLGQLIYVLVLSGYNVREGHFVKWQYNVAAFVRKSTQVLPRLYSDIGDIEALSNYWPAPFKQGFEGDMDRINWPPGSV